MPLGVRYEKDDNGDRQQSRDDGDGTTDDGLTGDDNDDDFDG